MISLSLNLFTFPTIRFAWKNRSFAILWTPARFPAAKDSLIVAVGNQTSFLSVTALTRLITKVPATIWDHSSWLCPNPPIENSPKDIFSSEFVSRHDFWRHSSLETIDGNFMVNLR